MCTLRQTLLCHVTLCDLWPLLWPLCTCSVHSLVWNIHHVYIVAQIGQLLHCGTNKVCYFNGCIENWIRCSRELPWCLHPPTGGRRADCIALYWFQSGQSVKYRGRNPVYEFPKRTTLSRNSKLDQFHHMITPASPNPNPNRVINILAPRLWKIPIWPYQISERASEYKRSNP